jgi:hypothetical protein
MIRADLTPGAPQGWMMVTPGKGNNFQRRVLGGGISIGTAGAVGTAPYWVKLTRSGNTITVFESANGTTWSTVGIATIALPATAIVGLAVSSHSATPAPRQHSIRCQSVRLQRQETWRFLTSWGGRRHRLLPRSRPRL